MARFLIPLLFALVAFAIFLLPDAPAFAMDPRPYGWTSTSSGHGQNCAGSDHWNYGPCPGYDAWTKYLAVPESGGVGASTATGLGDSSTGASQGSAPGGGAGGGHGGHGGHGHGHGGGHGHGHGHGHR